MRKLVWSNPISLDGFVEGPNGLDWVIAIDEYELLVHPVVLGSGKPMFKGIQRRIDLKLTKTQTLQSGVVVLRYQAAQSN
jgi:hypothetical protein